MTEPLTVMAVHAHPDDESSSTGGILARAADEGVRTVVVTCTNGELVDCGKACSDSAPCLEVIRIRVTSSGPPTIDPPKVMFQLPNAFSIPSYGSFASLEREVLELRTLPLRQAEGDPPLAINCTLAVGRHRKDRLVHDVVPLLKDAVRELDAVQGVRQDRASSTP